VAKVASEVRDGAVRVELVIDQVSARRIPLQHGLPGSVEIEVERTTPWTLLMRHAGRRWAEPTVEATIAPTIAELRP
jgi:membrane fusion protein (multidrug efflux system)